MSPNKGEALFLDDGAPSAPPLLSPRIYPELPPTSDTTESDSPPVTTPLATPRSQSDINMQRVRFDIRRMGAVYMSYWMATHSMKNSLYIIHTNHDSKWPVHQAVQYHWMLDGFEFREYCECAIRVFICTYSLAATYLLHEDRHPHGDLPSRE